MFWKRLLTPLKLLAISLILIVLAAPEWPEFQDERYKIDIILGQRYFDFLVWEGNAISAKGEATLADGQSYLGENTRKDLVLEYLKMVGQVRHLEAQVNTIYADPKIDNPAEASSELLDEISQLRSNMAKLQPVAESILQEQVATVIAEAGFELLGRVWPPVQMHMTPLPNILIVSPREEIRQIYNIPLENGLSLPTREKIESEVYEDVDRSALVVPIGGLGFYPSMIVETSDINYLVNTIAHEWAHQWLTFHPLGISYTAGPELRTMNETVASIFGNEVGELVIQRFYPEFIPPPEEAEGDSTTINPNEPPKFDFRAEMALTRNRVDELLAEGKIEEAEGYMEERRLFFWENGYRIRKLNQAYFAFYGAYADTPGEHGDDPVGPAILAVRDSSSSLRQFMERMASISSLEGLQREAGLRSLQTAN